MKTIGKTRSLEYALLAVGALLLTVCAGATTGDFYTTYQAKIVGHLVLPGRPARQMLLQREGRKAYLYVRQGSQQGFTVVDVTKPARPRVVNHVSEQNLTIVDSGLALSETPDKSAAMSPLRSNAKTNSSRASAHVPELVRVLDVSDPVHPRTVQTFDGVTSISRDDARSLIYVANSDGIWVLSHRQVLRRHLCSSSDAISSAIPNCD